jgi:two-component system sensor histidine kinase DegS
VTPAAAGAAAPDVPGDATPEAPEAPSSLRELADRLAAEGGSIQRELDEIDLLINQARTESQRHESRRQAAADKLAGMAGSDNKELAELANQVVSIGRKAALMEAQIDLLEGKRKSIGRLHDLIEGHAAQVRAVASPGGGTGGLGTGAGNDGDAAAASGDFTGGDIPPAVSRIVLSAQEDMRREIARAMHDGPAQSLTNIVLQAQIVERLLADDPAAAATEVHALTAMVQRTLDATKTFIFDVRPMVLDDLGLVPTLRRASRDRGTRGRIKVEFESVGVDRRLPVELESGLFRMLDDGLAAHVAGKPERLVLRLDWGEALVIELVAGKTMVAIEKPDLPADGAELPPALAAMVEERKAAYEAAVEAARVTSLARLPDRVWHEIAERSTLLGVRAELLDEGARLRLTVPLPPA